MGKRLAVTNGQNTKKDESARMYFVCFVILPPDIVVPCVLFKWNIMRKRLSKSNLNKEKCSGV